VQIHGRFVAKFSLYDAIFSFTRCKSLDGFVFDFFLFLMLIHIMFVCKISRAFQGCPWMLQGDDAPGASHDAPDHGGVGVAGVVSDSVGRVEARVRQHSRARVAEGRGFFGAKPGREACGRSGGVTGSTHVRFGKG
jgi:hypothetical protein